MRTRTARRRPDSAHLLALVAIVLAVCAPAGAALVNAKGIATNAVLSRHIKNGEVRSIDIGARQVANRNLAVAAVKGNNLATGSVGATQVADGSLTGDDLADGSITASDLATGTIPSFSIGAGTVTGAMLADGTVAASDIATGAVTASKVATDAVTADAIATDAVGGGALGELVGVGLTATTVTVPNDTLETMPGEETDGTVVAFATELWDSGGIWSVGTPSDVVIPTDGMYQVDAWVSWDANSAGYREAQLVHEGTIVAQDRRLAGSSMGNRINQVLGMTIAAASGDVVQLRISHQSGANLDADRVRLVLRRIGTMP